MPVQSRFRRSLRSIGAFLSALPSRRALLRTLSISAGGALGLALLLSARPSFAQGAPPPPPPASAQALPPPPPGPPPPQGAPPGTQPPGAQPGQPPQGYYYPPPGYGQPPPGYAPGYGPPPGYGQPPPGYGQPPPSYYNGTYPPIGPKQINYDEGAPIPPGYRVETLANRGLIVGGAVTFGTTYLLSAFVAAIAVDGNGSNEFGPLFIPVIGPFITIKTAESEDFGTFTLLLDGVAQAGGVAMFVAGMLTDRKYLIRNDIVTAKPKVTLTPVVSSQTVGLSLRGTL